MSDVVAVENTTADRFRTPRLIIMLTPGVIILLVSLVLPVAWLFRMSFNLSTEGGVIREGFTLHHYAAFLTDGFRLGIAWNSLLLSSIVTLLTLVLTYPIALFLYRWDSPWRNVLVVLTISPLLVSSVVRTFGWMLMLGDNGWVNTGLRSLGIIATPIRMTNNFTGVVIALTEILMPVMALALIAGFGRLDRTCEEAAASLGATPARVFLRIILPLSLRGVALGCLLCFVQAVSSFITPQLLGGGRVFLLATEIYDTAMTTLNWPVSAAISILLLCVLVVALVGYHRITRSFE
jgi:putative spermidine/putrescine transport system permease protein